ncbi:MAG: polysaccharide deacetylase family protein [Spirochaetales bacterium]|nr:polysaccharide deacetylase family protein [Spirochaetales bacterium]
MIKKIVLIIFFHMLSQIYPASVTEIIQNISNLQISKQEETIETWLDLNGEKINFFLEKQTISDDGQYVTIPIKTEGSNQGERLITIRVPTNQSGILLSFDDYYPSWLDNQDLFRTNKSLATFFLSAPSRAKIANMLELQSNGHEIGFHTITHRRLTTLNIEDFDKETRIPLPSLIEQGLAISNFAYPYGANAAWMHSYLAKTYDFTRGFNKELFFYKRSDLKKGSFIVSTSIDNIFYPEKDKFEQEITKILLYIKLTDKIFPCTSHGINFEAWGITRPKLEILLTTANNFKLTTYRFKDLIKNNIN